MGAIRCHGNRSSDLIFMFESVDARADGRTHGRRLESHPISSPCEPSAQVSLKCGSKPLEQKTDFTAIVIIDN